MFETAVVTVTPRQRRLWRQRDLNPRPVPTPSGFMHRRTLLVPACFRGDSNSHAHDRAPTLKEGASTGSATEAFDRSPRSCTPTRCFGDIRAAITPATYAIAEVETARLPHSAVLPEGFAPPTSGLSCQRLYCWPTEASAHGYRRAPSSSPSNRHVSIAAIARIGCPWLGRKICPPGDTCVPRPDRATPPLAWSHPTACIPTSSGTVAVASCLCCCTTSTTSGPDESNIHETVGPFRECFHRQPSSSSTS